VIEQRGLVNERSFANVARERLLSRVRRRVFDQRLLPQEALRANVTLERLADRVHFPMIAQGRLNPKRFLADVARQRLFVVVRFVMVHQRRLPQVKSTAHVALKVHLAVSVHRYAVHLLMGLQMEDYRRFVSKFRFAQVAQIIFLIDTTADRFVGPYFPFFVVSTTERWFSVQRRLSRARGVAPIQVVPRRRDADRYRHEHNVLDARDFERVEVAATETTRLKIKTRKSITRKRKITRN